METIKSSNTNGAKVSYTLDPHSVDGSVAYTLDPVGNRSSDTSSLSGVTPGNWTYNANDEQVSTETYDANGNTLTTGGNTFTYDSQNRLKTMNGSAVSIVYDAFGNRVSKTVGSVTTKYLVDDLNPTGYSQVIEEVVSGAVGRVYTYGLQRISEDQLVSNVWTPSYYGYDGGGTVRYLTNTAGTQTDTYDYDAFGNLVHKTGTTPNNYLYRGEQYDPDLGLYYLRARYYNPSTGRFMSRDPEDGKLTDPATLHKYLYAGGDPVNAADPAGREAMFETGKLLDRSARQTALFTFGVRTAILDLFCIAIAGIEQNAILGGTEPPVPKPVGLGCYITSSVSTVTFIINLLAHILVAAAP